MGVHRYLARFILPAPLTGFAEGQHLLIEKQKIREIPKGHRFVGRASLEKLFSQRSRGKAFRECISLREA
jgi:hypothetical protein